MAYPGDPLIFHASYIVLITASAHPLSLLDIVSLARLAIGVKKVAVIASTITREDGVLIPSYLSLEWLGVT